MPDDPSSPTPDVTRGVTPRALPEEPSSTTPDVTPDARPDMRPGRVPDAAAVMRRGLLVWGLGHLAIGDRRGWLLLFLQVVSTALIVGLGIALLEGSRDVLVFVALVIYLVIWAGQAIDAQRRAVALGAAPGGAIQILALAPVAITGLTLFWLVGGTAGSPAAVLQRYVSAWRAGQPEVASHLFVAPVAPDGLRDTWRTQSLFLEKRLESLELSLGSASGLDPRSPFGSLMFDVVDTPPSSASRSDPNRTDAIIAIDIVRDVTVRGTFFGLFPTASQQSVPVERVGTVTLHAVPQDAVFGLARGQVWRIASVDLPTP